MKLLLVIVLSLALMYVVGEMYYFVKKTHKKELQKKLSLDKEIKISLQNNKPYCVACSIINAFRLIKTDFIYDTDVEKLYNSILDYSSNVDSNTSIRSLKNAAEYLTDILNITNVKYYFNLFYKREKFVNELKENNSVLIATFNIKDLYSFSLNSTGVHAVVLYDINEEEKTCKMIDSNIPLPLTVSTDIFIYIREFIIVKKEND